MRSTITIKKRALLKAHNSWGVVTVATAADASIAGIAGITGTDAGIAGTDAFAGTG